MFKRNENLRQDTPS